MVAILIEYALRTTAVLALTALVVWLLRRRSAACRHHVWLAGLAAILVLPAAKFVAPHWSTAPLTETILARPLRTVITVTASVDPDLRKRRGIDPLLAVWLAGAALFLTRAARAHILVHRLVRRATPGPNGTLISSETGVPMVCGLRRPMVVMPIAAKSWPAERVAAALEHERMHIARGDTVSQAIAQLACAIYWPNPLIWLAASALRHTCEQACDDGVVTQGTKPSSYAKQLMEIARALQHPASAALAGGIAMTRTNQLEQRISALLNPKQDRRQAGTHFSATVAAAAMALVITLACVQTPLLAQAGRLGGVLRDPSGAVVPRARVMLRSSPTTPGKVVEVLYSNELGEFNFENIPDGTYDLTISAPGFASHQTTGMLFENDKAKKLDLMLAIGDIRERVQVQGDDRSAKFAAEAMARNSATPSGMPPGRIRVGGNVQAANLIHKVTPTYPSGAKFDHVEGTVIFTAVIGKDGSIVNLTQANKQVDSRLAEAATEAVKQWQYKPTLLNGEPVEVITQIDVNFTLSR